MTITLNTMTDALSALKSVPGGDKNLLAIQEILNALHLSLRLTGKETTEEAVAIIREASPSSEHLKQAWCITEGFIMHRMSLWERNLPEDFDEEKHEDIGYDALCGGLFRLSRDIADAVRSYGMYWDSMPFEYTHCEADGKSVWMPTVLRMSKDEWYELCCNFDVPEWVESYTHELMAEYGIPKAD